MAPLGGVFSHQTEVRRTELPLVISAVAGVICGIGDPFAVHQQPDAPQLPKYKLIFGIPHKKFRTGSKLRSHSAKFGAGDFPAHPDLTPEMNQKEPLQTSDTQTTNGSPLPNNWIGFICDGAN